MLTVEQVAAQLQVDVNTIRRWLQRGLLHGSRLPGKAGWRVPASDVQRFLASRAKPAQE